MQYQRIAVTGPPGCGKTTLVKRIADRLRSGFRVGGFYTEEIRRSGERIGFQIVDILDGRTGILAGKGLKTGPQVGRYRVCLKDLEEVGVKALQRAAKEAAVVVVDEIAPMELKSKKFTEAVQQLLTVSKPLLFAIHRSAKGPLLDRIRREFQIFHLTAENRDGLLETLSALLVKGLGGWR